MLKHHPSVELCGTVSQYVVTEVQICLCSYMASFIHSFQTKRCLLQGYVRGGIGKFSDCYCCNWLSERRWEGRPRSHFQKHIASVCHVTPCCEHTLFLHECFFDFFFYFVCSVWQNRAMCLHQVLRDVKLGKSATENLEMLREAFREHSLTRQRRRTFNSSALSGT
jgi:hypothetical protein